MKKSLTLVFALALSAQYSFANEQMRALVDGEEVKLLGGEEVVSVETPCHFALSSVMTSEEMESYRDQKCYGLKVKNAQVQTYDGQVRTIESFELPALKKRITASIVRESKECVDKYADKMNLLFDYQAKNEKQLDFGKKLTIQESYGPNMRSEVKIPLHYTIRTQADGKLVAEPSVKSIELESDNRVLNSLNSVVNKVVNKSAEITDVREGFGISQTRNGELFDSCSSVAIEREVEIDDEKYAQNLDGSVVNDSRKYLGNLWKKTVHTTGSLINNVTASSTSK